jgi:hypothetical protein
LRLPGLAEIAATRALPPRRSGIAIRQDLKFETLRRGSPSDDNP